MSTYSNYGPSGASETTMGGASRYDRGDRNAERNLVPEVSVDHRLLEKCLGVEGSESLKRMSKKRLSVHNPYIVNTVK